MGICSSCCQNDDSRANGETNERTHLLVDPVSNTVNSINRVQSEEFASGYNNYLSKRNDEQSALTKILNETANSVIDVSALDSHDLEQHEYYERMKAYKSRLNSLVKWSPPEKKNILTEVPVPEKILASEPISESNLSMMTNAVAKLTEALKSVSVEHKEDLVVPFRIP